MDGRFKEEKQRDQGSEIRDQAPPGLPSGTHTGTNFLWSYHQPGEGETEPKQMET